MNDLFPEGATQTQLQNPMEHEKVKNGYHTWSAEEEQKLRSGVERYGKDWVRIHQALLQTLEPVQIKNKYYTLVKRTSQSQSESSKRSDVEQPKQE